MNIGFTGSREGMTERQSLALGYFAALLDETGGTFHHGCCVGADAQASLEMGLTIADVIGHPPIDTKCIMPKPAKELWLEPAHYIERDHAIVDAVDLLIAAPSTRKEVLRSGIWATIRYAQRIGKPCIILDP